jgi:hypothetical protein
LIAAKGTISRKRKPEGMDTQKRIELLVRLGNYILEEGEGWQAARHAAVVQNGWFTPEAIDMAAGHIARTYLNENNLREWLSRYQFPTALKKVGIVMAGNIPLVGFHDFLCVFLSGHKMLAKLSSKDTALMAHLFKKLAEWEPAVLDQIHTAEMLKGCDAYIATGSNNTARYFEQYFGRYPSIIRRNRTSVAILDGNETREDLMALGEDIFSYFGLGCRNVTQVCVPHEYDFTPLLSTLEGWRGLNDHNKYHNNYDYHLALYMLNRVSYLDNGTLLMVENALPFSAVSVLHYRYYNNQTSLLDELRTSADIQAIIGKGGLPFGTAQEPKLDDYADGVDTMQFLGSL